MGNDVADGTTAAAAAAAADNDDDDYDGEVAGSNPGRFGQESSRVVG